ncbi:MAG: tRNA (adenosine(37)-N6)-threonylcarbamoyltransferase complex ATPase subunit type 1 TsaE [Desulfofustis sp.]|nr:tRNA (adenosine(37)-N6)-threonylcarbamoyltransferase complex ATPase subunit type 1 TsaE [Desulfofustis sp.]
MKILSSSLETTIDLGKKLGSICEPGDVICLAGDLGAGKTTMVQAIAAGAGVDHKEYVNSPTFAILHEHHGRIPIYHMDFFRLGSSDDVVELGLEDYFYGDGLTLIEWFERAGDLIPESVLVIELNYMDELTREISLYSASPGWRKRIDDFENLVGRG